LQRGRASAELASQVSSDVSVLFFSSLTELFFTCYALLRGYWVSYFLPVLSMPVIIFLSILTGKKISGLIINQNSIRLSRGLIRFCGDIPVSCRASALTVDESTSADVSASLFPNFASKISLVDESTSYLNNFASKILSYTKFISKALHALFGRRVSIPVSAGFLTLPAFLFCRRAAEPRRYRSQ